MIYYKLTSYILNYIYLRNSKTRIKLTRNTFSLYKN